MSNLRDIVREADQVRRLAAATPQRQKRAVTPKVEDVVGCLRARLDEVEQENRRLKDHLRYHGHDGPECNVWKP